MPNALLAARTQAAPLSAPPTLSADEFDRVRELIHRVAGIVLSNGKEGLVRSRLFRRLHALKLQTVWAYLDWVEADGSGHELANMVDALSTNKTEFFRERAHLDLLQHDVFPALAATPGEIRVWSAGCATGEEAYSIAMMAQAALGDAATRVRILATDISERALRAARTGAYAADALRGVDQRTRHRWFTPVAVPGAEPRYRVNQDVRALVRFGRLNLIGAWPMRRLFDVIFCRNVMIYFDRMTQQTLMERFSGSLTVGGYLYVGHSESLWGVSHDLRFAGPAIYQK
jgi:chemotaxis protein methyltransferase CheR